MLNVWSALERRERVGRALTPRGSGRGRPDRARQVAEEDGVGAGAGEGDAHPAGGLGDAGGDLQEPEPDRREFGLGEGMCLGTVRQRRSTKARPGAFVVLASAGQQSIVDPKAASFGPARAELNPLRNPPSQQPATSKWVA
jgi:hypothetical protein